MWRENTNNTAIPITVRPYGKITRGEVFKIFCVALDMKKCWSYTTPTVLPTPTVTPKVLHSGGGSSISVKPATVDFTSSEYSIHRYFN